MVHVNRRLGQVNKIDLNKYNKLRNTKSNKTSHFLKT